MFDDIINKEEIERKDLELILDKIVVYQGGNTEVYLKGQINELIQVASFDDDDPNDPTDPKGFSVKTPNKKYHSSVVGRRLRRPGFCRNFYQRAGRML